MEAKAKTPTTPKVMPFAHYLAHQIEICGRTQREIALEIGYTKPNIITMFKQGLTKVPIEKVAPLAKALGVDPQHMLRMAMMEYAPAVWEAIEKTAGLVVTSNEAQILEVLRESTNQSDPKMHTNDQLAKLIDFGTSLMS